MKYSVRGVRLSSVVQALVTMHKHTPLLKSDWHFGAYLAHQGLNRKLSWTHESSLQNITCASQRLGALGSWRGFYQAEQSGQHQS